MIIFNTSALKKIPTVINIERNAEVFNEVLQLHKPETPDCAGLFVWYVATEERCGLGTRLGMRCKICRYVSKRYNLYSEVSTQSPSRKAATVNYGIQMGFSQTSLGNNGLRKIQPMQTPHLSPAGPCKIHQT